MKNSTPTFRLGWAAITALALSAVASANPILAPNTGLAPINSLDPNYSVLPAFGPLQPAIVITPNPAWTTVAGAQWIGTDPGDGNGAPPPGIYKYFASFSMAGLDPSTATFGVEWSSDNESSIFVNGNLAGTLFDADETEWSHTMTANLAPFLTGGVNTIEFDVTNDPSSNGGGNPTGVIAAFSGLANPVPEPASMAALGLSVIALVRRKKKA